MAVWYYVVLSCDHRLQRKKQPKIGKTMRCTLCKADKKIVEWGEK
jgi:hypothetical protein